MLGGCDSICRALLLAEKTFMARQVVCKFDSDALDNPEVRGQENQNSLLAY